MSASSSQVSQGGEVVVGGQGGGIGEEVGGLGVLNSFRKASPLCSCYAVFGTSRGNSSNTAPLAVRAQV